MTDEPKAGEWWEVQFSGGFRTMAKVQDYGKHGVRFYEGGRICHNVHPLRRIPTAEELAELVRERDEARAVAERMAVIARDLQRYPCARHGVDTCPYLGCSEPTDLPWETDHD